MGTKGGIYGWVVETDLRSGDSVRYVVSRRSVVPVIRGFIWDSRVTATKNASFTVHRSRVRDTRGVYGVIGPVPPVPFRKTPTLVRLRRCSSNSR